MRTLFAFIIDHDNTTDAPQAFIEAQGTVERFIQQRIEPGFSIWDATLSVDIPETQVLPGGHQEEQAIGAILDLLNVNPWGKPCPDCGGMNQQADGSFACPPTCQASGAYVPMEDGRIV